MHLACTEYWRVFQQRVVHLRHRASNIVTIYYYKVRCPHLDLYTVECTTEHIPYIVFVFLFLPIFSDIVRDIEKMQIVAGGVGIFLFCRLNETVPYLGVSAERAEYGNFLLLRRSVAGNKQQSRKHREKCSYDIPPFHCPNNILNVEPSPSLLSSEICPPICSTKALQIYSPSPQPGVKLSTLKKRSKISS